MSNNESATVSNALRRFQEKVIRSPEGCWVWVGWITPQGYGRWKPLGRGSKDVLAHRWAYEQFVGAIPVELELDHLCRKPRMC